MAGFALALLGGAARGWGEGQLANIKSTREEKLKQLELDRADRLEGQRQEFLASENALNRTSTEKLAEAQRQSTEMMQQNQLSMQKTLTEIQESGATGRQEKQIKSAETIARENNVSTESINAANRAVQENIANAQNATTKTVAQLQADTQLDLGISQGYVKDPKTGKQTLVRFRGGKRMPDVLDEQGNVMELLPSDSDPDNVKAYKYLTSIGIDQSKATDLAFPAAGKSRQEMVLEMTKAIIGARGDFAPPATPEDDLKAGKTAETLVDSTMGGEAAPTATEPAAGSPDSTVPAKPTSAVPALTPAQKQTAIAAAKRAVMPKSQGGGGKDPAAVAAQLETVGITRAEAGF